MTTKEEKEAINMAHVIINNESNLEERDDRGEPESLLSKDNDRNALIANFYAKLGKSGGKVFEVTSFFLCDRKPDIRKVKGLSELKGFTLSPVNVISIDTEDKPKHIKINRIIDIPLVSTGTPKYPCYFYDEEDAIKHVHRENTIAYEAIEEAAQEYTKAAAFMREVSEKNLY